MSNTVFDAALQKRFEESSKAELDELSSDDVLLIKIASSGEIKAIELRTLIQFIKGATYA